MEDFDDNTFYIFIDENTINNVVNKISEQLDSALDNSSSSGSDSKESIKEIDSISEGDIIKQANYPEFADSSDLSSEKVENIKYILDIELDIAIELGRTRMSIKDILELTDGSIIELDRLAGEPVDVLVNGKVVAKGEVIVIDENFGVRLTSLVSPEERLKSLK